MSTVLIADGCAAVRALLRTTLAPVAATLLEATDGNTALAVIRQRRPTVAVIDQWLPHQTGTAITEAVRGDPALADTRIVVLSAEDTGLASAVRAGADLALPKPFSPRGLRAIVQDLLECHAPSSVA